MQQCGTCGGREPRPRDGPPNAIIGPSKSPRSGPQITLPYFPDQETACSRNVEDASEHPSRRSFAKRFENARPGETTHREVIELAETREFGSKRFEWRAKASGWKWARVAVGECRRDRRVREPSSSDHDAKRAGAYGRPYRESDSAKV